MLYVRLDIVKLERVIGWDPLVQELRMSLQQNWEKEDIADRHQHLVQE